MKKLWVRLLGEHVAKLTLFCSVIDYVFNFLLLLIVKFQPKEYLRIADKAASFIKNQLYNTETHRLQHSFRNSPSKAPGFLDDYAFLISGLLDLYEFGGEINWLLWAIELQETQVKIDVWT